MLGRPPTASEVPSDQVRTSPSKEVRVPAPQVQPSSGFQPRQTSDGSTASTNASTDINSPVSGEELLIRLNNVDKKLDDVMLLVSDCLAGIDKIERARPSSAGRSESEEDEESSDNGSRPSSASSVFSASKVVAEAEENGTGSRPIKEVARPSERPADLQAPSDCWGDDRTNEHLKDSMVGDAWTQPNAPVSLQIPKPGGWRFWGSTRNSSNSEGDSISNTEDCDSGESPVSPGKRDALHRAARKAIFKSRSERSELVWNLLEESDSSFAARVWTRFWCFLVTSSVVLTLTQTLEHQPLPGSLAVALEVTMEIIFAAETVARFLSCPDRKHMIKSTLFMIDVLSVVPFFLRAAMGFQPAATLGAGDPARFILLCVVPIVRLLKYLRKEQLQLKLFESMVDASSDTLQFLGYVGVSINLTFAATLFLLEPEDNVESFMHASYLCLITMTTVGYGDITPVTDVGKVAISVLAVVSALYMALPIGVLGNAFSSVWKDRDLILLVEKTRRKLAQWGYREYDLSELFKRWDVDGDGELDLSEFRIMVKDDFSMNLPDERIVDLFEVFDKDRGGSIDDMEFLHVVFPGTWHALVQKEKEEEEEKARLEEEEKKRKEVEKKAERKRRKSINDGESLSPRGRRASDGDVSPSKRSPRPSMVPGIVGEGGSPPTTSPRPGYERVLALDTTADGGFGTLTRQRVFVGPGAVGAEPPCHKAGVLPAESRTLSAITVHDEV